MKDMPNILELHHSMPKDGVPADTRKKKSWNQTKPNCVRTRPGVGSGKIKTVSNNE